ncbi:MAG: DNA polymerase III subunit beta [Syntrophales bacterium]|nr:DNA polymerase III subunit beta [Syntrophales bacterium]
MEFTVDRNVFQEAVQRTLGIVERKTTIPILNNILIKVEDRSLRIVATDREIGLISDYGAEVAEPGEITVNAKKLHEMVREMEGERVFFSSGKNNQVRIVSSKAEFRIPGIQADDFPEVHQEDDVPFFTMPCRFLKNMIRKTFYAASTDETRSSLNGAFFKKDGVNCEMVATDGHRLSLVRGNIPDANEEGNNVEGIIIPRKGLNEIRKMVEDGDGTVEVGIGGHVCVIKKQDSMLRVSLVDAVYPEYNRVIPKDRGIEIVIEKKRIMQSLRRMGVMANELFSGVIITLLEGIIKLNSTNPDVGEANEEIAVDYRDGTFSVGYNVRYLIEAIDSIDDEMVSLELRSGGGAGVVKIPGNDSFMSIIMPITIVK